MTDIDKIVDVITNRVEKELSRRLGDTNTAPCNSCASSKVCDSKNVIGSVNQGAARIGSTVSIESAPCAHVAPLIDHTLLKPEATREEIKRM